jgi:DNA-directed RNA polymerase subunit RPC12/RpoP
MSIEVTHLARFQGECSRCDSKVRYLWSDTEDRREPSGQRYIVCPTCQDLIAHKSENKIGYLTQDDLPPLSSNPTPGDGHAFTQHGQNNPREMADGFCSICGGYRHEHRTTP